MADNVSKKKRSAIMQAIKNKDSKIEIVFRKLLWNKGFRYRKNSSKYFGKPDIVLKKLKAVIFLDSCFWHGCKIHCRIPSTRTEYWKNKIKRNTQRDSEVTGFYKETDWKLFRFWEHEIKANPHTIVENLSNQLRK